MSSSRSGRLATMSSCRSGITASGSRRRTRAGSSSASTRSIGSASAAAARAWAWRSRGTSSASTAAGSGSSRRRGAGRRSPSPCPSRRVSKRQTERVSLQVATLNIRNLADRWDERLPLILADMAALQPAVLGLQEVVYVLQQDRLIGAAGEGRYESIRGWAGRPEYGNATLVRAPLVPTDIERLDLGLSRSAIRSRIAVPGGGLAAVTGTP